MINLAPLKNRPPYAYALGALAIVLLGFLGCRAVRWYRGQDHKAKPADDAAQKALPPGTNLQSNSSTSPSSPQITAGTMTSTTNTVSTTSASSSTSTAAKMALIYTQTLATTNTSTADTTSKTITTTTTADITSKTITTTTTADAANTSTTTTTATTDNVTTNDAAKKQKKNRRGGRKRKSKNATEQLAQLAQPSTSESVVQPPSESPASQKLAITVTIPTPPQESKRTALPTPASDYRAYMVSPQSSALPSAAKDLLSPTPQTRARDFKSIRTGTPAHTAASAHTPSAVLVPRKLFLSPHTPLIKEEESEAPSPLHIADKIKQIGFYTDQKDAFTDVIKQFTETLFIIDGWDITADEDLAALSPDIPIARYDILDLSLDKGRGQIGFLNEILFAGLSRGAQRSEEWALTTCRILVSLFPYHIDAILKVARSFTPTIDTHRAEIAKEQTIALRYFQTLSEPL